MSAVNMECGSLLPLSDRERFPSAVLSAIVSTKAEALAKEDAQGKAAASRRAPKRHRVHVQKTASTAVLPLSKSCVLHSACARRSGRESLRVICAIRGPKPPPQIST